MGAGFVGTYLPVPFNLGFGVLGQIQALQLGVHLDFTISQGTRTGTVINLTGFEIPEKLEHVGGTHRLAVHDFPGGERTFQMMGAFPALLRWSGVLLGIGTDGLTPLQRATKMDLMRWQGDPVIVNYGGQYTWTGIITDWSATIMHQTHINYTTEVTVLEDNNLAIAQPPTHTPQGLFSKLYQGFLHFMQGTLHFSAATVTAIDNFLKAIKDGLGPALGVAANIAPNFVAAINSTSIVALSALVSEAGKSDLTAVQNANAATSFVKNITNNVNGVTKPNKALVPSVNPRFTSMATTQLADAKRWPEIAVLNGTVDVQDKGIKYVMIPKT